MELMSYRRLKNCNCIHLLFLYEDKTICNSEFFNKYVIECIDNKKYLFTINLAQKVGFSNIVKQ